MGTYDDDIIEADSLPKWREKPDRPLMRLRPHPITDDLGAVAEHLEAAADILGIGIRDLPVWLTTHVGAVGQLVTDRQIDAAAYYLGVDPALLATLLTTSQEGLT